MTRSPDDPMIREEAIGRDEKSSDEKR